MPSRKATSSKADEPTPAVRTSTRVRKPSARSMAAAASTKPVENGTHPAKARASRKPAAETKPEKPAVVHKTKNSRVTKAKPAPKAKKAAATRATKASTATESESDAEELEEPKTNGNASKVTKKAANSRAPKANGTAKQNSKKPAAASKPKGKVAAVPKANTASKRKAPKDDELDEARPVKSARTSPEPQARANEGTKATAAAKKRQIKQTRKPLPAINKAPTDKLNVYVFGEGTSGELSLGTFKVGVDVKRPRLNMFLLPDKVGVVHVAVGGMHCAALTHDNKILTWGVNDQGALGRDTEWEGNLKDIDAQSESSADSEDDDNGLNPKESMATAVSDEYFPEGTKFVQLACGDSTTFAVTEDGSVYGWGIFRSNEGNLGFSETSEKAQRTPVLIPELKKIKQIACGANHCLALTEKGTVLAWGSGQQYQLGRRLVERNRLHGLVPREVALPKNKIVSVAAGAYHSFAIDQDGKVWAWGLNSYGETGVADGAGEDEAVVMKPTAVKSLAGKGIAQVCGGGHHSIAVSKGGECLVWGRVDGCQSGLRVGTLPKEDLVFDERGQPRILAVPTAIPGIKAQMAAAGTDGGLVISQDGQAFSWGFSGNYQTGQGTIEDVETATLIDNTAVRGKKLNWAGAGGQFTIITSVADVN
ncbi:MAG: hypothetical protein M1825_002154 [Sarcosagium campestre]|nr:MAG: hypothetical protein M1825_002154 [Sarcosagium campestre]